MMNQMKAIIIDDEEENIDQLRNLLSEYCKKVQIIGMATNAVRGAEMIIALQPDLVFLDIQMPGKSGFDMLASLGVSQEFDVIFITGYEEYAIQAIRCSALDYLLKPVKTSELIAAIKKAEKKINDLSISLQIDNLLNIITHPDKRDHTIALPVAKGHRFINPYDIIYLQSSNNYTDFKMIDKETILISKGLYTFEEVLADFGLIRCHASYIVNPKYISKFSKAITGFELLLSHGQRIPVTKMYMPIVNEVLGLVK